VGTWQEVVRELIEAGADESGMMLQRSSRELDRGPVLSSCRYPLRGGEIDEHWADASESGPAEALFDAIRARGVKREPHFLVASLQAVADGRISIPELSDKGPNVDLTADVEAALEPEMSAGEGSG
jgi:phosphoribosylglycinamide formyltransferase-1